MIDWILKLLTVEAGFRRNGRRFAKTHWGVRIGADRANWSNSRVGRLDLTPEWGGCCQCAVHNVYMQVYKVYAILRRRVATLRPIAIACCRKRRQQESGTAATAWHRVSYSIECLVASEHGLMSPFLLKKVWMLARKWEHSFLEEIQTPSKYPKSVCISGSDPEARGSIRTHVSYSLSDKRMG